MKGVPAVLSVGWSRHIYPKVDCPRASSLFSSSSSSSSNKKPPRRVCQGHGTDKTATTSPGVSQ